MSVKNTPSSYPRPLTGRERELIAWILPGDRTGYREYRSMIETMNVIGEGRRGKGEIILGREHDEVDFSSPLAPVFAYGAIETNFGAISITLREIMDNQISVEIVSQRMEEVPVVYEEARRWSYSMWNPGSSCPQCSRPIREVPMHTSDNDGKHFVLAVCSFDKRLWVYDAELQVNRLIPLTNFYNELMLHKNIRDPKIALDAKRLFHELPAFTDEDLSYAFLTYNNLKTKVHVEGRLLPDLKERKGILRAIKKMFTS